MKIDPYTLVAQLLNFLVLAALLSRFIYRPVLAAADLREKSLSERVGGLELRERQCGQLEEQLRLNAQAAEQQRAQARAEVEQEVQQLHRLETERARREIAEQRQRWEENLKQEFQSLRSQRSQELGQLVLEIARRALKDLADQQLDDQIVTYLLDQVGQAPLKEPVALCAHPLSESARQRLAHVFPGIRFEESPQLLGGVVLKDAEHRLAWSIESYLEGLAAC